MNSVGGASMAAPAIKSVLNMILISRIGCGDDIADAGSSAAIQIKDPFADAAISAMQKNKPRKQWRQDRLRLLFKQAQSASIAAAVGAVACTLVF